MMKESIGAVYIPSSTLLILYAVLYVSKDKTEWKYQRPDKHGFCNAYVYNADEPDYSEGGEICVQGAHGGLFRTA